MSGLIDKLEIIGVAVGAVAFFGIAFWRTNYSAERNYVPETENTGKDPVPEGPRGGKRKSKRKKK